MRRLLWRLRNEWEGVFALNVDEAWTILDSQPIDAVVSDMNMPGKSGLDLLNEVRQHPTLKLLPFFILTGNTEPFVRQVSLEGGATDYLSKPADFNELVARLKNALVLKDLQDAMSAEKQALEGKLEEQITALEQAQRDTLFRLAKAAEARDVEVGNHIARVGAFSRLLAEELGYDAAFQRCLLFTAPLHDIGKIGIPDSILRKPGPLTPEERIVMETHSATGATILSGELPTGLAALGDEVGKSGNFTFINTAAKIARSHHERWDGKGYPDRIAGEAIPIEARIVSVTDVFDALRNPRPYKGAIPLEKTLQILEEGKDTQFDRQVVEALERRIDEMESILAFMADTPKE